MWTRKPLVGANRLSLNACVGLLATSLTFAVGCSDDTSASADPEDPGTFTSDGDDAAPGAEEGADPAAGAAPGGDGAETIAISEFCPSFRISTQDGVATVSGDFTRGCFDPTSLSGDDIPAFPESIPLTDEEVLYFSINGGDRVEIPFVTEEVETPNGTFTLRTRKLETEIPTAAEVEVTLLHRSGVEYSFGATMPTAGAFTSPADRTVIENGATVDIAWEAVAGQDFAMWWWLRSDSVDGRTGQPDERFAGGGGPFSDGFQLGNYYTTHTGASQIEGTFSRHHSETIEVPDTVFAGGTFNIQIELALTFLIDP